MSPLARTSHHHKPRLAMGLKLLSVLAFCVMALCIKMIEGTYSTGEIIFSRSFFGIIPLIPLIWLEGIHSISTRRPWRHFSRGMMSFAAMSCTFYALPRLPLATFTTISFTMPLFVAVLAAVYLKEQMSLKKAFFLLMGFAGVIIVVQPGHGFMSHAAMIGLLSAFLVAIVTIYIRRLTATEHSLAIVMWFSVSGCILSFIWMIFDFRAPTAFDALMMVMSGLMGGIGQVLLTQSYRFGPVSLLTTLEYSGLLWALFFGYIFRNEIPTHTMLAGALLIIAAGLMVIKGHPSPAPT